MMLTVVPRINDMASVKRRTFKQWMRFYSLCMVVVSGLWLILAISMESGYPDWAIAIMLASIATSWACSPSTGNWVDFVFRHHPHNQMYGRRSTDHEDKK